MTTMAQAVDAVGAGIDTHLDTNMAAALNGDGAELDTRQFPRTAVATERCSAGWPPSARCCAWAWRAPAPTAPASSWRPGSWSTVNTRA